MHQENEGTRKAGSHRNQLDHRTHPATLPNAASREPSHLTMLRGKMFSAGPEDGGTWQPPVTNWQRGFGPALWHPRSISTPSRNHFSKATKQSGNRPGLSLAGTTNDGVRSCGRSSKICIASTAWPACRKCESTNYRIEPRPSDMKKPIERPIEQACPACNGKGIVPVKLSARSGVRIYPPRCKECDGKGRLSN